MRKILSLILGLLWTLPAFATLPTGYTRLEYIESTGTQYINTGYRMTNTSGIKIVIDDTATNSPRASTAAYFVGSALQGSYMGYFTRVSSNVVASVWAWNGENVLGNNITSTYSTVYINYMNDRKFIYNNGTRDYVREGDLPTLKDATGNLYLFNTSSGDYIGVGKMYSAQITENQSIVRNFVPAKNASGVVGMYDTVGNRFYTNAGTGEFVAGPDACRNLFDGQWRSGIYNTTNGTATESENRISNRNAIAIKPNTQYTVSSVSAASSMNSLRWLFYDENKNFISFINQGTTITSPENARYLNFYIANNFTLSNAPSDVQIEEGTTATAYVPYCSSPIKIATTKYNETAFSPLNTALQNAISVVDSVVSNTITQAGRIATLQAQKQTRPNDIADDNEKCPAGKKCLLVEDASGIPHWYEIVENAWDLPVGYTQLQYIESTGEQYLDLGYAISKTMSFEIKSRCLGASFVFGGRASSSSAVSGMNYDQSGSKIGIRMGSVILYDTLVWQEGTDYTVSIQNGNVSIDGRTVSSATYGNDYYTGKAYLFATNDNGHLSLTV
ncbi:MAG: hypothetical protein IJR92_02860, partial [Alphaproteobacteria bacterium]|nr:hypothetical protein [Alphaproteobacteria bacterium]